MSEVPDREVLRRWVREAVQEVVSQGSLLQPPAGPEQAQEGRGPMPRPPGRIVAVGSDHGGFDLKEELRAFLTERGYQVTDCGCHSAESVDYPDFAREVAQRVALGHASRGIMVDGAGIGSSMACNKVPGIRAALCWDVTSARNAREHNDANVLTLGGQLLGPLLARQIVQTFLETDFAGGRHARRVEKIMALERGRP